MVTIVTSPFGLVGTPGLDVVCEEDAESPKILEGKEPRWQAIYNIFFTDSELEARLSLELSIPTDREGLVAESYEIENRGGGLWRAEVLYSLLASTAEEEFDTTGGSATVKLSYGTRSYGPGAKPVFNGAINCNGGRVDGVSIPQPAYTFNYTRSVLTIDFAYKQLLYRNVGKYNNETWKGFAAGEVLFLGSRGRKSGRDRWKLQWFFAASPNLTNIQLGPLVNVTRKDGWEYLWVLFDEAEDTTARQIVQRPRAAYVEQVHLPYNFAGLGLGV